MYGVASFIDEAKGSGQPEAFSSMADMIVHHGCDGKGMFLFSLANLTNRKAAGTNAVAVAGGEA